MEILIVDDEQTAISGISVLIDWKELDIDKIWTALTINEARNIIQEESIDFLLCDIEMRNENGLHLVDWVNKNYCHIGCIIVTGHVNFAYTRKAVELKVTDYLSKPLDAGILKNALKKAIRQRNELLNEAEGERQNKISVERHFFRYLLKESNSLTKEEIREEIRRRRIAMPVDSKYCMLLVKTRKWNEEYEKEEYEKINFSMITVFTQDILKAFHSYVQELATDMIVICFVSEDRDGFCDFIKVKSEKYVSYCKTYFLCEVCVYIDDRIGIEHFSQRLKYLKEVDYNNLLFNEGAFIVEERKRQNHIFIYPDLKIWQLLLENGSYEELKRDIVEYMESDNFTSYVNPERLRKLIKDFEDMITVVLSKQGTAANTIWENQCVKYLRKEADKSVAQCIAWFKGCIDCMHENDDNHDEDRPVVEIICKYIEDHIEEDISRNTLAKLVYMSPDYMTRIFKKEKGVTISEYLLRCKLERAANLLIKTEFSISYIASNVGYSNISHFSGAFKKQYGLSPSEYRKEYSKMPD
ncbi:MAG: helix-turn-helix domain-containing protein [Lachnospiraceae bacterium]|nr:helix-turn-helix domain-containing protein [Lachnospiraceae bacterium]